MPLSDTGLTDETCRNADLKIMNGRYRGDSLGKPTWFHGKSRVSIIDYAICDQDVFHSIANFIVYEPSSLSDHSPIMTRLNINTVKKKSLTYRKHQWHINSFTQTVFYVKMIHHKNLKQHFKQETYRERYMIFLLIAGKTNTLILVTMQ